MTGVEPVTEVEPVDRAWARPVPTVGDPTSAAQRAADPRGWAFAPEVEDGLHAVLAARRDVRSFRPDPLDDDLLARLVDAAHHAPSVGHSQPWRFVVVRSGATRDRAAALAERERLRQADLLAPERRAAFLDLRLDGIRDAPVGIVVCCDRRVPAAGVIGRATFADADMWSTACAVQNLWLAARAAGLGVGWVTLFGPDDLAGLVGLPPGVETLGWLCVGWPDERLDEPGLERHGWSERLPAPALVMAERWADEASGDAPAPPVSHLAAPSPPRVVGPRDEADGLLAAPQSLGALDRALDRVEAVVGVAGTDLSAALVLAGADHPVAGLGVSAYPASVTREVLEATVAGCSLGAATASSCGLAVVAVDAGVDGGPVAGARSARPAGWRGDLLHGDALHADDVRALIAAGTALAERLDVDLVALGEVGIGNTTVAAALVAALTGREVADLVGRGVAADTAMVRRKGEVVAGALARVRAESGAAGSTAGSTAGSRVPAAAGSSVGSSGRAPLDADPLDADPLTVLAAVGGPEVAVLVGVVLGAARSGRVVVLDGLATGVAALVAARLEPAVTASLVAGQRSREPAHGVVLTELGLEPLLDLRLRAGEGVGAVLACHLLRGAAAARRATARVTDPSDPADPSAVSDALGPGHGPTR